jgi:uncharacterized membrane protein YhaH (DUF805 family)
MENIVKNFKHVVLENYTTFTGRAGRAEYWYYVLAYIIICIIISIVESILGIEGRRGEGGILNDLFSLAVLLPSIAVGVRRLHDSDKSGWWLLLPLYNLYLLIRQGTVGPNRFGPGSAIIESAPIPAAGPQAETSTETPTASSEPTSQV